MGHPTNAYGASTRTSVRYVHLERLKLPPVTRIFTSPLLRCAQTAAAAATHLGIDRMCVEPSLAETICEDWYQSWAVEGADSTWGGKGAGVPVDETKLHKLCREPASSCHNSAAELNKYMAADVTASGGSMPTKTGGKILLDLDYQPFFTASEYSWGNFETHEQLEDRMARFINAIDTMYPDETILCVSHGGPTSASYSSLCPAGTFTGVCGYTGMYLYVRNAEASGWEAVVAGDQNHLHRVGAGTLDGPSSVSEQTAAAK